MLEKPTYLYDQDENDKREEKHDYVAIVVTIVMILSIIAMPIIGVMAAKGYWDSGVEPASLIIDVDYPDIPNNGSWHCYNKMCQLVTVNTGVDSDGWRYEKSYVYDFQTTEWQYKYNIIGDIKDKVWMYKTYDAGFEKEMTHVYRSKFFCKQELISTLRQDRFSIIFDCMPISKDN